MLPSRLRRDPKVGTLEINDLNCTIMMEVQGFELHPFCTFLMDYV